MRKLILLSYMLITFIIVNGQVQPINSMDQGSATKSESLINYNSSNKTATCVDTVFYPHSKMTSFSIFQLISESGNSLRGFSQTYNANTGIIHGINAYILLDTNGIVGDAAPLDMYIKVFNVDALDRPISPAIDSTLVTVTDLGTTNQTLLFATPVAVSARYAIAIELDPLTSVVNQDSVWFLGNNDLALPPDGAGEGLMALDLMLPGFGWTNFFKQFTTADYDALISPIFEKTITSSYTTSSDTICLGDTVQFVNTSNIDTRYMYNQWDSLNADLWTWNYDDGSGTYNHYDTTYTFTSGGVYNTQLLTTNYGYTNNCVDSIQRTIVVSDPNVTASADTIICTTGLANISVTGNAISYLWDNGLGAGQSHAITPTIDTMYVVTGTDANQCVGNDTVFVSIAPCNCVDTVYYPHSKMTSFSIFQLISESGNSLRGFSQTYNANTGLIHGINAYILLDTNGIVGDAAPLDMYIKVFNVDALDRPISPAIDSTLVTVTDLGTVSQTLLFTSPIAVSARYAIAIELDPLTSVVNQDSVWFLGNNDLAIPPDGAGEGLMALDLILPGFGWTNFFKQFTTADYDALISPIFDKTITSSYTTSSDTICLGDTVQFVNTSNIDTSYMYNQWDSLNADLWTWNYDDGSGTYNHYDTTYTFTSGGVYNTQLLTTNYGYTNNCVDSSQHAIVVQSPTIIASSDTTVCLGDTINLSATGGVTYAWDNGLGIGQSHLVSGTIDTIYVVTGMDAKQCVNTDTVHVMINPIPIVIASNDTSICFGTIATISALGATTYTWNNGLGGGEEHDISPTENTIYIVTGDDNGCIAMDTVIVTVDKMCFEIPNVFTPNGDGRNDVWNIAGLELFPNILVQVFNRWGDLVFESEAGYIEPWDGMYNGGTLPSATYYYVVVKGDGSEGVTGTINIVR